MDNIKDNSYVDYLKTQLPSIYFDIMDVEDYKLHRQMIKRIKVQENQEQVLHYKGDIEDFFVHKFDTDKLRATILKITSNVSSSLLLYRIFFNEKSNFILSSVYKDIYLIFEERGFNIPSAKDFLSFFDDNQKLVKNVELSITEDKSKLILKCINVAHNTLLSNLFETLSKHSNIYNYISIWQVKQAFKNVDKCFYIEILFEQAISEQEFDSLNDDFVRYIQSNLQVMSVFDIVGPAMVGPSSSHTAGANRIGQISRQIILSVLDRGESIKSLEVKLFGSFRDTGVGHRTPSAVGGGLSGFGTYHPEMIENGEPELLKQNGIKFNNQIAEFKGYKKASYAEDLKYISHKNHNIAEILFVTDKGEYYITGFSIGAGNVEIRYFNKQLTHPITGKTDVYLLNSNDIVITSPASEKSHIIHKIYNENAVSDVPKMDFNTFEELIEYASHTKRNIIDIICETEKKLQNLSKKQIYARMQDYWHTMQKSVLDGVNSDIMSMLKLSGGDANRINNYLSSNSLFNNIYGLAAAYSIAVNEINAKSGVIIACPTAGSCGIVPGVLVAWTKLNNCDENKILEALLVAGFFGMILFTDVSTAGADYGCQAEIGAAAAMAASALVYLENGSLDQMIQAFILAIKNSLGLICDPVAGLVEVPCVKRNGIYSSLAITASLMALSNVQSFISPDEVVLTMREVGERLHVDYKETGRAGLAKTRDGKQVEKDFKIEVDRFFN